MIDIFVESASTVSNGMAYFSIHTINKFTYNSIRGRVKFIDIAREFCMYIHMRHSLKALCARDWFLFALSSLWTPICILILSAAAVTDADIVW